MRKHIIKNDNLLNLDPNYLLFICLENLIHHLCPPFPLFLMLIYFFMLVKFNYFHADLKYPL